MMLWYRPGEGSGKGKGVVMEGERGRGAVLFFSLLDCSVKADAPGLSLSSGTVGIVCRGFCGQRAVEVSGKRGRVLS